MSTIFTFANCRMVAQVLEGMEERLIERTRDMQKEVLRPMLDAAVESIGTDFSDLRSEMGRRFDLVGQRFDALELGMDRMDTHIGAVLLETAGVKVAELTDRRHAST